MKRLVLALVAAVLVGCGGAQMEALDTSRSSFITMAEFTPSTADAGTLVVGIGENTYTYEVTRATWTEFKAADSLGSYYNQTIKTTYSPLTQ